MHSFNKDGLMYHVQRLVMCCTHLGTLMHAGGRKISQHLHTQENVAGTCCSKKLPCDVVVISAAEV